MSKTDIAIATAQDIDGINKVTLAHRLNPTSRYEPPYPLVLEDIVQSEKRITFVARNNDKIIGYLSLHSDKSFQDDSNNADFEMVVHPDHQEQGNGKYLLEFAILYAEKKTKLNQLIAKVLKDNYASKRLCENFGFCVLNEENKGYLMALDCDVMSVQIKEDFIIVRHKNEFSTYLSDWFISLQMIRMNLPEQTNKILRAKPKPFHALGENTYELSFMLYHLNTRMQLMEKSGPSKIDPKTYSEARVFLKSVYIYYRILLDTVAAVLEYFYKKNEQINLPSSFRALISKQRSGQLPDELSNAIQQTLSWFPDFKSRRDDLVHHYQSFLILFQKDAKGNTALDHTYLNSSKIPTGETLGDIREYVGFLLKCYQELIDSLLNLFDLKFQHWYGIVRGHSSRTETILEGLAGYMLWWASVYGNYQNSNMQIKYED